MKEPTPLLKPQLVLLFLVTGIFFLNFLSRVLPAPLMPTIENDLGLHHVEAGGFFLFISIGYCISLMGSGYLSAKFAHRKMIIFSSLATGSALMLVALSRNHWEINIALVIMGLAAGAYLPSGITTITSTIPAANWGKAIAVHEIAPTLSYIVAPLTSEVLLTWLSWQGVMASFGIISIMVGLLFWKIGKGGDFKGEVPNFRNIKLLMQKPDFWTITVLFSLGIAGGMGVYSMLPLYLVAEQGFERGYANAMISISRIPVLIMALLSGWVSDRLGPRRTIEIVFVFGGIMTILLGVASGDWVLLMVFLQPMLTACFFPAGFSMLSSITPSSARNISVSVTIFIAYLIGAGLIPAGMGLMGDAGHFGAAFSIVGFLTLCSVILLRRVK